MPKVDIALGVGLCEGCILLLPLFGVSDSKAALEYLSDSLKRHTLALRVAEHDKDPANKTDATVETEGAYGSEALHHGEEGRRDDDVGTPAGNGVQHGSYSTNFGRDQFSANPSDCGDTRGEESDVADDADQNHDGRPASDVSGELKCLCVDGDVVEADSGNEHADSHAQDGDFENSTTAEAIDEDKVDN